MKLYIINYYPANTDLPGDCYPDFCHSRQEAETIAPAFMQYLDWAVRWEICEEDQ